MRTSGSGGGEHGLSIEVVNGGTPAANEPAPRSDAPPVAKVDPFARPNTTASVPDPNELKPSGAPDPNELKPSADPNELTPAANSQAAVANSAPLPPPAQLNEIQPSPSSANAADSTSTSTPASDQDISSSKKKKKKGLKKIVPF